LTDPERHPNAKPSLDSTFPFRRKSVRLWQAIAPRGKADLPNSEHST
jgi:hypothetical protein